MTPKQEKRFLSLVRCGTDTECWPWLGTERKGRAAWFFTGNKSHAPAKAAWELWRGPVPKGLLVVRQCGTRNCVNPAHRKLGGYTDRHMGDKEEVTCKGCGAKVLRVTNKSIAKCEKCRKLDHFRYSNGLHSKRATEARRYRIMMHVLGWEDSEFEEMLAEMKASPMAFRDRPEGRVARLNLTNERKDHAARKRLLDAYADGVEMAELEDRFGRSAESIMKLCERAGVARPDGYHGQGRRVAG